MKRTRRLRTPLDEVAVVSQTLKIRITDPRLLLMSLGDYLNESRTNPWAILSSAPSEKVRHYSEHEVPHETYNRELLVVFIEGNEACLYPSFLKLMVWACCDHEMSNGEFGQLMNNYGKNTQIVSSDSVYYVKEISEDMNRNSERVAKLAERLKGCKLTLSPLKKR